MTINDIKWNDAGTIATVCGVDFDIRVINYGWLRTNTLLNEGGQLIPLWNDKTSINSRDNTIFKSEKITSSLYFFTRAPQFDQTLIVCYGSVTYAKDVPLPEGVSLPGAGTTATGPVSGTTSPKADPTIAAKPVNVENPSVGALLPESGKVTFEKELPTEYNVLFWGDGFTSANNMGDIVMKFAEADGIKLNFSTASYDNIGTSLTYNLYECFSWTGSNADSEITSLKKSTLKLPIEDPEHNKVDYCIIMTSRDRGISLTAGKGRNTTAVNYLTTKLHEAQPDAKFVLLVPSGYKEGHNGELVSKISLNYTTLKAHNDLIREFASQLLEKIPADSDKSAIYICDAFEFFTDNYAPTGIDLYDFNCLYPSMAGSYYMACVVYSSLFGNASSGLEFYGYIDSETAKILQGAADAYVVKTTGKDLAGHPKTYAMKAMTIEQVDPRNQPVKEGYENEVYAEGYNYLLASAFAYFQREDWVQYDNLNMDRVNKTFSRRTVTNASPEEATPQQFLYTDCSAYLYAAFVDAFNENFGGANRTNSMFDSPILEPTRVFYWRQTTDERTPEQVSADFYAAIQPGDLILFTNEARDGTVGHTMLYLGNGTMIHTTGRHATGGGENYLYDNGTDEYEMISGVILDSIDEVGTLGRWLCPFKTANWLCAVFRPLALDLTPTEQAINRVHDLRNIVAYKETTAPRGVTVNQGDDVTFTFVIRNENDTAKEIKITDTLSGGLSFKSGDAFTVSGKELSATVTVPAYETLRVSYTVTVDAGVAAGTLIECHSAYLNGVLHNETPVAVAKTLTAEQQAQIPAAADEAGKAAKTEFELIASIYKQAFGADLPFSDTLGMYYSVIEPSSGQTFCNVKADSPFRVDNSFGGKAMSAKQGEIYRNKRLTFENLIAGDVLLTAEKASGDELCAYVYLGDGVLATVVSGKYVKYNKSTSLAIMESLNSYASYCVIRPSMAE